MITNTLIFALCLWSVNQAGEEAHHSKRYWRLQAPRAIRVCQKVATRAHQAGINPLEAIAVSYVESRHNEKLTSEAGAIGAMQAMPKYWVRKGDKDSLTAGLRAWKYYRNKYKTLEQSAGRYNGAGAHSEYAKAVRDHYDGLVELRNVARYPL